MSIVLTPDELGETGETLFANLCARSGLICNKSHRDRTGWDFVVEFPMSPPGAALALDQRLPTACAVQLKTTSRAGPARLSLSAADRLAKDPRPAFIVLLHLTPAGEPRAGYLIHLLGPALNRVLHRLRAAHARARFDINTLAVSFDHRKLGVKFDLTPEGLAGALRDACGDDRAAYAADKQRQLDELGYEEGGLQAEALFWVESADQLNDIVLGLQSVRPDRFRAFDTRFGISLPYTGPAFEGLDELRIRPPRVGPCTISIRGAGLSAAAVFEAEMFAGMPAATDVGAWLLIRHPDFTLKFGAGLVAFNSTDSFDTTPRSLTAWIHLARGLAYLAVGDGVMTITPAGMADARFTLPMSSKLEGPYLEQVPEWVHILEGWDRVLGLAGVQPSEPFSLHALWAARGAALAADLFGDRAPRTSFAFGSADLGDAGAPVDSVYVNTASLAGSAVSYSVRVTLDVSDANPAEYRSIRFQPLDVRPAVPDLQTYAEEIAVRHGLKIVINPANMTETAAGD